MITGAQIKAARALADWDREKLSKESGVSISQISALELGTSANPRNRTLTDIEKAFLQVDIIFKDGGVFPKLDPTTRFTGEGWFLKFLEDIQETLREASEKELLIFGGDDKISPLDVVQKFKQLSEMGVTIREMVKEGNTYLIGPEENYRWIPKSHFHNYVTVIYADKVCIDFHTHGLLIKDKHWAIAERNKFNLIWSRLPPLEIRSSSDVRI